MSSDEINRTLYCGNLDIRVTEETLYELFLQAGPLEKVKIPTDRDGRTKNFAFITFRHEASVPYTISLMNGIQLFDRMLKLQFRPGSSHEKQKQDHQMGSMGPPLMTGMTMQNHPLMHRSFSAPNMDNSNERRGDRSYGMSRGFESPRNSSPNTSFRSPGSGPSTPDVHFVGGSPQFMQQQYIQAGAQGQNFDQIRERILLQQQQMMMIQNARLQQQQQQQMGVFNVGGRNMTPQPWPQQRRY